MTIVGGADENISHFITFIFSKSYLCELNSPLKGEFFSTPMSEKCFAHSVIFSVSCFAIEITEYQRK